MSDYKFSENRKWSILFRDGSQLEVVDFQLETLWKLVNQDTFLSITAIDENPAVKSKKEDKPFIPTACGGF